MVNHCQHPLVIAIIMPTTGTSLSPGVGNVWSGLWRIVKPYELEDKSAFNAEARSSLV